MQVTETLNEGLKRGYKIVVPAAELDAKVTEKLEEARPEIQMKGFRKGHVPLPLLKRQFGRQLLGEAMQEAIDNAMRAHFEQTGDRPAAQPDVRMTNEDWKEGDDVEVEMTYERLPEIPEFDFSQITLEKLVAEVTDADLDEALKNLSEQANHFEDREEGAEAREGDRVVIDFKGSIDGVEFEGGAAEDYPLVLGSGSFIPGFEDQLIGAKAGDEVDVKVTFPENYGAEQLAGKEAVFACKVKAVQEAKPAPIDDELANRYGAESLEALKEQLKERIAEEYASAARALMKRALLDQLDEKVAFELPPSLVESEAAQIAHQLWHDENPEHHGHDHPEIEPTDEHRKLAARRVKLGLFLAEIGRKNDIQVTEDEMHRALMEQARQYPGQEAQFFQFVQQNPQVQQQLRAPIYEDKVVDYIVELAQVTEKTVTKDDLQKAIEALDED